MSDAYEAAKAKLVNRWATASKHTTTDALSLGRLAHLAIKARLRSIDDAGTRRTVRASCVHDLRASLAEAGCDRAADLNRWIACYAVANALGADQAATMSLRTIKAFIPLVRRDAKRETWGLRRSHTAFAEELWARAATMTSAAVDAEVRTVVFANRKPRATKPVITPTKRLYEAAVKLPRGDILQLVAALQKRLQASESPQPTLSVDDAPVRSDLLAGEKRPLSSIFGRKAG